MDAPPAVAYQHLQVVSRDSERLIALVICALQLLLVQTIGRVHIAAIVLWIRSRFRPVMLGAMALLLVLRLRCRRGRRLSSGGARTQHPVQLFALVALVAAGNSLPARGVDGAFQGYIGRIGRGRR
jgi:hypothetical protein